MWDRIWQGGRAAWALIGVTAAVAIVLWLCWQVRVVFPPLVLAGAIVFILNPVVTWLQRHRVPRAAGTGLTYLMIALGLVLVGFLVTPLAQRQADELAEEWPQVRDDVEEWIDEQAQRSEDNNWIVKVPTVEEIRDQLGGTNTDAFTTEFDAVVEEAAAVLETADDPVLAADLDRVAADAKTRFPTEDGIAEQLARAREIGTRIFEVGLIFILAPIIAFYLLVDLPHLGVIARELIPSRAAPQVLHVAHRLNHAIGGYFRGQLAVAFIVGVMVSTGLAIIGLPFWLIVGMIAGLFNMIPLIGPWVGAVPGVVIALTTGGGFSTAIWVIVVMTVAQQIDNHFISPLVMQRTTSLHPAVVMLALLAGGTLGGFFGLLLAVPVTASLKVIFGHLWRIYVLEEPLDDVIARDHSSAVGATVPLDRRAATVSVEDADVESVDVADDDGPIGQHLDPAKSPS